MDLADALQVRARCAQQDLEFGPFAVQLQEVTAVDCVAVEDVGQRQALDVDVRCAFGRTLRVQRMVDTEIGCVEAPRFSFPPQSCAVSGYPALDVVLPDILV